MAEVSMPTNLRLYSETVSAATKTLDAADCGHVQVATVDTTITLPATVVGYAYTIMNGGTGSTDGTITIAISPNAADLIQGAGFTAVDNKDITNTNGQYGDYVKLVGNGTTGWTITEMVGTWTYEA